MMVFMMIIMSSLDIPINIGVIQHNRGEIIKTLRLILEMVISHVFFLWTTTGQKRGYEERELLEGGGGSGPKKRKH